MIDDLILKIQSGEDVSHNMQLLYYEVIGLAMKIGKSFFGRLEADDIKQEAYIALDKAVKNYSADNGAFSTYYVKVLRRHFQRLCNGSCTVATVPEYMVQLVWKYNRLRNVYLVEHGNEAPDGYFRFHMGIDDMQLNQIKDAYEQLNVRSLDYVAEETDMSLAETIPSDTDIEAEVIERISQEELSEELCHCLCSLKEIEKNILIDSVVNGTTSQELSHRYGLTEKKVNNIKYHAIKQIRKSKPLLKLLELQESVFCKSAKGSLSSFKHTQTSCVESFVIDKLDAEKNCINEILQMFG